MTFDPSHSDNQPDFPEDLRRALGQVYGHPLSVPAELDERILRDARGGYDRRMRRWLLVRWCGAGLAAAAAVAFAVRIFITHPTPAAQRDNVARQVAQLGDVDHNGRVDVLDAYTVARRIARHEPLDPSWDVNGDGVVDEKDVDLIAHMAVRVTAEAR